jgi:hypothetical protein
MENSHLNSKIVVKILIGGIVGIGAIAVFLAHRKKETSLGHIGEVISKVGEILESHHVDEPAPFKNFGKKVYHHENTVGEVVDWVATGMSLWKKFIK